MKEIINEARQKFGMTQHDEELIQVLDIIKKANAKNFVEIGTSKGGTFYAFSKVMGEGEKISVDMLNGNLGGLNDIETQQRNKALQGEIKNSVFITGNSHNYDIYTELKNILGNEEIDILFIDGDHSYNGVKKDFEMYKPLVKEGGLIIFHDIIDTEYHRQFNCYVSKLWGEIKGEKKEIVTDGVWGGFGVLFNKKVDYECYQIYFDNESKKGLNPLFKPYYNRKKSIYFENDVIKEIYKKLELIDSEYVGTVSWKFNQKTKFTSGFELENKIQSTNAASDIIMFTPKNIGLKDCIKRNKEHYTELYRLSNLIDSLKIYPFQMDKAKWTPSYCNYWIAKKHIYKDYVEKMLLPLYNVFENNSKVKNFCANNFFKYNGKDYHLAPFLMELLMGFYVNHYNISNITIEPDNE